MSRNVDRDDAVAAFDAAVTWWHDQLDEEIADHADTGTHPDRPSTARDYFETVRGFDADTIAEWRLGWAPADGGLYDHLRGEGFEDATIRATGLFCEDSHDPLWRGRYIFPYFSADGTAEYAIARCTGSKGGGRAGYGGHPNDFLAGKYAKVAHTRENVPLSEPILGLHTLADAEEVVVAEGIADAITASEAGYAVLSPVTKEFKSDDYDAVVAAIQEHGVERAYVTPDAELAGFAEIDSDDVPESPDHASEAINIPTVAPGPGGGLRTANYLREQGIDARLVTLPRSGLGKVDLDDYLHGWADDLAAPIASAKPPEQHPQFDAATATQAVGEDADTDGEPTATSTAADGRHDDADVAHTGASGLFALDVGDVNPGLEAGYRGKNPLGHVGDSETYFVVREHPDTGDLIATDYKRPGEPRYTGVTYLLVEIGERPVEAPMGELSPAETWAAWSEARERGLLAPDDVIPAKALEHIARKRDLWDFAEVPDDAEVPVGARNRALGWVNGEWADETDAELDDHGNATARTGRRRIDATPHDWQTVRYIYEESKAHGREAARTLLSDRYEFMTLEGGDSLRVYDPETGVYTEDTSEVRGEIYDGLVEWWSTHELNEIQAGLRQHDVVKPQAVDAADDPRPLICVQNGVLDPLARELHDHSPEYHFTTRVPVAYDADADTEPYEKFLDSLVERDADRKAMVEMVGHALLPDANQRYKKFLILTGDTDNGKSQFYSRVEALLNGPDGQESNTAAVKLDKLTENQFSKNSMYGSLANIAGEIDGKKIRKTADLKDITGGDEVEIEPKGRDSFFDTINSTLMFAANDPPIVGERDKQAIASRIVPIELPYTFVDEPEGPLEKERKPERELAERLEAPEALSGFLSLALDGIARLEANHGDVSLPEAEHERLRKYERSADPMREFGERCLENAEGDYVVKADVTTIYKEYATSQGHEVSENVGRILHNVLRGVPDLNYTDSRPVAPDYSDTSLPLRGWDDRKWVISRVTLTEEGLEYAEQAGLITEEDGDTDAADEAELADLEPGFANVRVTVAEKFDDHPEWQAGKGHVVDDDGNIAPYIAEGTDPLASVEEGDTVSLRRAKVEDRKGVETLVLSGVTEASTLQQGTVETETAAADGGTTTASGGDSGPPADAQGRRPDAQRLANRFRDEGHTDRESAAAVATAAKLVLQDEDMDPESVEQALEYGSSKMTPALFMRREEDGDRLYWCIN
jgi:P4 family phage/plasmid primase-like protien